jgi:hypothetical protein
MKAGKEGGLHWIAIIFGAEKNEMPVKQDSSIVQTSIGLDAMQSRLMARSILHLHVEPNIKVMRHKSNFLFRRG